jgi:hypothetical protein
MILDIQRLKSSGFTSGTAGAATDFLVFKNSDPSLWHEFKLKNLKITD